MKESQLENKTSIATNDCVRMVDENGNSVKIKKDSFMAAIRDALPSILESGGTGGGSVLSVIGGILKTRTDADLASVLGGFSYNSARDNTTSFDNLPQGSIRLMGTSNAGRPSETQGKLFTAITFYKPYSGAIGGVLQLAINWQAASSAELSIYVRQSLEKGGWSPWKTVTLA